jgi:hypothetical protein
MAPPADSIAGKARRTSIRAWLESMFPGLVTDEMVEAFIAEQDAEQDLEGRVS